MVFFIGINVEKAHLLTTIINNIEMKNDYYQKASLHYVIKESDPLFNILEKAGIAIQSNYLFYSYNVANSIFDATSN